MNDVLTPGLLQPLVPPPLPATVASRMEFINDRPRYVGLVMRGALLELVTVGFYRFWLATDMRRHLWSHTSVEGDAPEYTGTAKELFIGFLFALAIIVPLNVGYFLIGLDAARLKAFASGSWTASSRSCANKPTRSAAGPTCCSSTMTRP